MNTPSSALFIQLRRIGDILMCTPAIRAFKELNPSCKLDFLTEWPDVLRGNPNIRDIITVDASERYNPLYQWGLINNIRKRKYDLVVDFLANPRSAYYSFLTGANTRLSYGYGHRKWAYNLIPPKADKVQYAALDRLQLIKSIDVESDAPRLEFYPDNDSRKEAKKLLANIIGKPIVSISPVSRHQYNCWPLEKYAELGRRLSLNLGMSVVIVTGPGESDIADKMSSLIDNYPSLVLKIDSLALLGAIFENVSLHIGNDNGPKHIAVACGAPTITIYGPHSPIGWTYPDSTRHLWIAPKEFCEDCATKKNRCDAKCIAEIPVDAVWEKAQSLVNSLKPEGSPIKKS